MTMFEFLIKLLVLFILGEKMQFELLETFKEKELVKKLNLCDVILENKKIPWVLLIPRRSDVYQINQLSEADQLELMKEINIVSNIMEEIFPCDRLNVAAIGNKTLQLHIHVICRTKNDDFWPETIWGKSLEKLTTEEAKERARVIRDRFDIC